MLQPSDHVNHGWKDLVNELHQKVLEIDPDVKVVQVKEKFGGLRYYYESDLSRRKEIDALVNVYESKSYRTCEVCGAPGELRNDRLWLHTLCDEHISGDKRVWEKSNEYRENLK